MTFKPQPGDYVAVQVLVAQPPWSSGTVKVVMDNADAEVSSDFVAPWLTAGEVDQLRAVVRAARDFRNVCEDAGYQHAGANYGPLCDALDAMGHTL